MVVGGCRSATCGIEKKNPFLQKCDVADLKRKKAVGVTRTSRLTQNNSEVLLAKYISYERNYVYFELQDQDQIEYDRKILFLSCQKIIVLSIKLSHSFLYFSSQSLMLDKYFVSFWVHCYNQFISAGYFHCIFL